jgi:hypothetical protein
LFSPVEVHDGEFPRAAYQDTEVASHTTASALSLSWNAGKVNPAAMPDTMPRRGLVGSLSSRHDNN